MASPGEQERPTEMVIWCPTCYAVSQRARGVHTLACTDQQEVELVRASAVEGLKTALKEIGLTADPYHRNLARKALRAYQGEGK